MSKISGMLMEVEDFVYDFYDADGQLTETYPVIVAKAKEKFGITFGEYAEEVLNGPEYDMRQAEAEYRAELALAEDGIPF